MPPVISRKRDNFQNALDIAAKQDFVRLRIPIVKQMPAGADHRLRSGSSIRDLLSRGIPLFFAD